MISVSPEGSSVKGILKESQEDAGAEAEAVENRDLDDENVEKERLRQQVEKITVKVEELEDKVKDLAHLHLSSKDRNQHSKSSVIPKEKDKEKIGLGAKKQHDISRRESGCSKRMAELMRQFGTILRQITQHKWAWPFMTPVDVKGLGLHDYHDVIKKPMDLGTVRRQMDAKDGTGYKNVREICEDVRLVFKNAMTYNDETSDVHVMAKTLLQRFEEKWNALLPKVIEEEERRKQEEEDFQSLPETATEKSVNEIRYELDELNKHLEDLKQQVAPKCRMMSIEEKRLLGKSLGQLSPEHLARALQIIAQKNPNFKATEDEVEIDIDAQDASTLWQLQYFVKAALSLEMKNSTANAQAKTKRKKEICDAIAKTARKRSRKML
eukprot:TRINITY_DN6528_c0_g1_i1.p1 TRINITY_DN6528_c0_g1~~TRINITY_DN6528_c0_g1_i1.p1  ORF type:complete len:381 (-),score=116.95 TRINITY_DN6528_c0_g1_i1:271-1413(-)